MMSDIIYCENGWHDMQKNISFVTENAFLEEDGRSISGDTLYYEAERVLDGPIQM